MAAAGGYDNGHRSVGPRYLDRLLAEYGLPSPRPSAGRLSNRPSSSARTHTQQDRS